MITNNNKKYYLKKKRIVKKSKCTSDGFPHPPFEPPLKSLLSLLLHDIHTHKYFLKKKRQPELAGCKGRGGGKCEQGNLFQP